VIAAFLGACQRHGVSEAIEQRRPRVNPQGMIMTIDAKDDWNGAADDR
jgi:hypothetical protein